MPKLLAAILTGKRRLSIVTISLRLLILVRNVQFDEMVRFEQLLDGFEDRFEDIQPFRYSHIEEQFLECEHMIDITHTKAVP